MPPDSNIDMEAIQAALQRRAQGMGGTPPVNQATSPMGALPTGGPNTPMSPPPMPPAPPMGTNVPPRAQTNSVMKAAQGAQGPSYDDETKVLSKTLIKKLLEVV